MKANELTRNFIDYCVAVALGYRFWLEKRGMHDPYVLCVSQKPGDKEPYKRFQESEKEKLRYTEVFTFNDLKCGFHGEKDGVPSFTKEWSIGGPVIESKRIEINTQGDKWIASRTILSDEYDRCFEQFGKTPLIAAMRCFVASEFGADYEFKEDECLKALKN